jgi:beta-glucosidase
MPRSVAGLLAAVVLAGAAAANPGAPAPARGDANAALEQRVEDLLARLTLAEKISLMSGGSSFGTQPIARLGIPALHLSDGPNGVRSNNDQPATVFPTGSALAATWNPAVLEAVGTAIGREARAMNVQVMLGPNVNIQRSVLAGRNFETYSEDPLLAGRLGAAFVRGVQSQGVGTSVKHFVGNEQELERMRSSSNIDERTLREVYLLPFEIIVKEAKPWTVMAAYNRLNGTYMTENSRLIREILKGEWGFDGLLMSDWGAVHSTVPAAASGLDLEMPGPARYFGRELAQAVRNFQVDEHAIDEAARRMLRTILRSGVLDGKTGGGELRSARSHETALNAAREAIALLKNEPALLPLDRARVHTLAVLGPNADVPLYEGGGSASVIPGTISTPLMSLNRLAGAGLHVDYARGVDNDADPPPADARLFSPTAARTTQGLKFSYFDKEGFDGVPIRSGTETFFDKTLFAADLDKLSARWEGVLWPPETGTYELSLSAMGNATLSLDGRKVLGEGLGTTRGPQLDFGAPLRMTSVTLEAGHPYPIRIEYLSGPIPFHSMRLGLRLPPPRLDEAIQLAHAADAVILFVGSARATETEGRDRRDMELPGRQNELVQAVLAANPNTIVVLNNGSPLALPWVDKAPAIVEGWLPGEAGAEALAQILLGEVNPSGKLPFTFPRRIEDSPSHPYYSGGRDANYGEGVFVGYRWYDKRAIEPLFAFGHGLSYTTFEYSNLRVPGEVAAGHPVEITVDVRNTGRRAGAETVQLYVGDEATKEVVRPLRELKAFEKVALAPGETRTVRFTLSPRDLAYYDVARRDWTATPGAYRVFIGSSSRDIRLQQPFESRAPHGPG